METALRIDHGSVQNANMSYSQRQPPTHRSNHAQPGDLYKPSRSPLTAGGTTTTVGGGGGGGGGGSVGGRYPPYPSASPQLQPAAVPPQQRYAPSQGAGSGSQGATAAGAAAPPTGAAGAPTHFTYRDIRPPRISLLPAGPEYLAAAAAGRASREFGLPSHQQQPLHVLDQSQPGPFKKIRLQDSKDNNMPPLRIDTRPTYNPQVEAISPTPDHAQQQEDAAFRTTKDDLLQQIGKVDREIAKAESQISIHKKKQQELEDLASKPVKDEVDDATDAQPKHQSLAQKIYAENRRRAQNAHASLDAFGPKVDWPIYNQPSDAPVHQENKRRYVAFKKRLLEYFKRRHAEKDARNTYLTETYSKLMQEWLRKVDKIESSTKRKAKEAKNREFFEKVFPELRKQREDKERFNRVGARIKSEADMEELMDNLQEQAMEDKKMRSYAVIPPMLFDAKDRAVLYRNNNGHIEDMEAVYKRRQFLNVWTTSEKELFKEKYLQHPKNFGMIATYLDRKSVSDCVQYYYLSKKTENYKQLLRKSRQRTRSSRNNPQKVNSAASTSAADILTTGVTTRLQREQQQKTGITRGAQASAAAAAAAAASASSTNNAVDDKPTNNAPTAGSNSAVSSIPVDERMSPESLSRTTTTPPLGATISTSSTAQGGSSHNATSNGNGADSHHHEMEDATSMTAANVLNDKEGSVVPKLEPVSNGDVDGETHAILESSQLSTVIKVEPMDGIETISSDPTNAGNQSLRVTPSPGGGGVQPPVESKKKKERRKDKENQAMETTDEECTDLQDKNVQGQCIVCGQQLGAQLQSRPLLPSQASQYGLREDQVPATGRVCNTCRCKCVRSRYTHCPLPTCPNSRGRVKRLRTLPQRLLELPPEVREPILDEFHIVTGVTKCCSACFTRIQRRLGPVEEWPDEEVTLLKACLTELGAAWQLVGERMNKPAHVVRSYYAANRKRHNLESCLGDRKPTLTDEEESGSSTSSCEGTPTALRERHSSDTASAESPPVSGGGGQESSGHHSHLHSSVGGVMTKKEDYDSSATETADEGQTPDHYQGTATITADGLPPITVKDLMSNVIEHSLKKQTNQHPPPGGSSGGGTAPTISSILNDSNEVTIVSEYNLGAGGHPGARQQQSHVQQGGVVRGEVNIAKVQPLIAATITPVPGPVLMDVSQGSQDMVVMQVNDSPENLTLDLSVKKPARAELPPPAHSKRPPPESAYITYLPQPQEQHHPKLYHPQSGRVPKLPSPKLANPKAGSITLGTPIVSQPRYEGLLRQMPPEPKMGSITQGTPIHVPHIHDKRIYDFYKGQGMSPAPPPPQPHQQQQQQKVHPAYATAYRPQQMEQMTPSQMTSRQIIMNDYITSQHMSGRRNDAKQYYTSGSPHRTPPPPHSQAQQHSQPPPQHQQHAAPPPPSQQRQGVIQRHTRPMYHPAPPPPTGHEALNSLVDVAVQQPSLPVPSAHEGLGKTMADNLLEQPRRFQMLQHQQHMRQQQQQAQQHRMEVERRMHHHQQQQQQQQQQQVASAQHHHHQQQQQQQHQQQQQQQRQSSGPPPRSDTSTQMTAASLIDAIITHQINQSEDSRQHPVTNNRGEPQRVGDRLFQVIQREASAPLAPQQQADNNGDMSPHVINIDLDGESNNKNLTVKEIADTIISHDFSAPRSNYYHLQQQHHREREREREREHERAREREHHQQRERDHENDWKRRMSKEQEKRSVTPQQPPPQDERQIIRITSQQQQQQQQQAKYHLEPVSPTENHHWGSAAAAQAAAQAAAEQNYRATRYPGHQLANQSHMSPLDYMKNRIVEVMRTSEDDKKEPDDAQQQQQQQQQSQQQQQQTPQRESQHPSEKDRSDSPGEMVIDEPGGGGGYAPTPQPSSVPVSAAPPFAANEPKPLLSAQYESLSDED